MEKQIIRDDAEVESRGASNLGGVAVEAERDFALVGAVS